VAKSGALTLPAKKLYEIVKALQETDVRIEQDRNGVKVAADRFDSRMQTLPREDFPSLPEATDVDGATLPRDVVRQMVAKTQFAITGEDTRYFLNGALFILRPDSMSLVATDGHRLALITVPREGAKGRGKGSPEEEARVILPRKTLLELARLLAARPPKRSVLLVAFSGEEEGTLGSQWICFNAQYVVDFLNVVDTDGVGLEFKDEMSQAVMKPLNADGYDYTYVIMPMRI
jgi:DNA polymerase-3 subunit beta